MSTLTITRGYQGSGKTTLARRLVEERDKTVRVNRDDLRKMSVDRYWPAPEAAVSVAQQAAVAALLEAGWNVIVDDTNLKAKVSRAWADLAASGGHGFEVLDVTTDVDVCVLRDELRVAAGQRGVGENVIRDYAARYPMPWPPVKRSETPEAPKWLPYVPNPAKPAAILMDLDGTAARNTSGRGWYDWARVGEDEPNEFVISAATAAAEANGAVLIALSGRDSACRLQTNMWLDEHAPAVEELFMRPQGDQRSDDVVKNELFDQFIRDSFNVLGVFDDRPKVCRMWRAKGLEVLQIGDPHREF